MANAIMVPEQRNDIAEYSSFNRKGIVLRDLNDLARFAKMVYDSGLAPKGFGNAQAVAIAVEMGLEMGLSPMMSVQNIAVINGRPGIYGDAAKALVESSGLLEGYEEHPGRWCDVCEREGDAQNKCPKCGTQLKADEHHGYICTSWRRGRDKPVITGFNIRQSKKAGLWGKAGPWTQYPNRMLMFRARGFNLRDNFPDVLKGFKTVEELRDYPTPGTPRGPVIDSKDTVPPEPEPPPQKISTATLELIFAQFQEFELSATEQKNLLDQYGVQHFNQLTEDQGQSIAHDFGSALEKRRTSAIEQPREPGVDEEPGEP